MGNYIICPKYSNFKVYLLFILLFTPQENCYIMLIERKVKLFIKNIIIMVNYVN